MPRFKVLITDYAWPEVTIERETLAKVDALKAKVKAERETKK